MVSPDDIIQIAFDLSHVENSASVLCYMNVLSNDDPLMGRLGLRKLPQLWGHIGSFQIPVFTQISTS